MVSMYGTERQVEWADDIRSTMINVLRFLEASRPELFEDINKGMYELESEGDASWYIENFKYLTYEKSFTKKLGFMQDWLEDIEKEPSEAQNEYGFGYELLRYLDFEYIY